MLGGGEEMVKEEKNVPITPPIETEAHEDALDAMAPGSQTDENKKELSAIEPEPMEETPPDEERKDMIVKDSKHRVKLYVLNEHRHWDDRGTGHVACIGVVEADRLHQGDSKPAQAEQNDPKASGLVLYVVSEGDDGLLLNNPIQLETSYQKQQETLIVWSESENCDLALSFQDKAGCDEIWERICQIQGRDPTDDPDSSLSYDEEDVESSTEGTAGGVATANVPQLPEVTLENVKSICDLFTSCSQSPMKRENLALLVENEGYIPKLIELFRKAEDEADDVSCKVLYQIVRTLLALNKNSLLEILFRDDLIKDTIGILEYDPLWLDDYGKKRKGHRTYLWKEACFKEVIPMSNQELKNKIHQTFRVEYLQDMILPAPSIFDENMLSALSSFVFFNRVEIVALIQDDEHLLDALFTQLKASETEAAKRRELMLFLKEYCMLAQTLHTQGPQGRDNFFKSLSSHGVLEALERCLSPREGGGSAQRQCVSVAVEVLSMVVDCSAVAVREYMMAQARNAVITSVEQEKLFINLLVYQLFGDPDPELSSGMQLQHVFRLLFDPENMIGNVPGSLKSEKTEFLSFLYKHAMSNMVKPLLDITSGGKPSKDDYHTAHKMSLVLETLTNSIEHHTYFVRNFFVSKDLLKRVLVLLKSKHHFLVLSALRLFRRMVSLKDEFYNRHIVRTKAFEPVVEAFHRNGPLYNLLNSAMLELFEYIRTEEIKTLLVHFVETYIEEFKDVTYVRTFESLRLRYDQYRDLALSPSPVRHGRWLGGAGSPRQPPATPRQLREPSRDEAEWFNEEDEWEDELPMAVNQNTTPPHDTHDTAFDEDNQDVPPTTDMTAAESDDVLPPTTLTTAVFDDWDYSPVRSRHDANESDSVFSHIRPLSAPKIVIRTVGMSLDSHMGTTRHCVSSSTGTGASVVSKRSYNQMGTMGDGERRKEVSSTTVLPAQSSSAPVLLHERTGGLVDYDVGDSDSEDDDEQSAPGDALAKGDTVSSTSSGKSSPARKRTKVEEESADNR